MQSSTGAGKLAGMTSNQQIYRVTTEAGFLAGTMIPSPNGQTRAYSLTGKPLGSFATVGEAIEAVQRSHWS